MGRTCKQCGGNFPKEKTIQVHGVTDCLDCAISFYRKINDKKGIERVNKIKELEV